MDIGKSFSYQFEDKQWISKLGIGAMICFIPILNFTLSGYMVGIMRNIMDGSTEPLPGWDDLEKKFIDGLILFGASLIYSLPILIIFMSIGMLAFSALVSGNENFQDVGKLLAGVGGVLFVSLLCLIMIYVLILSVVNPAILVMFARHGTFASCFKLREAFGIVSRNAGPFFTAWVVYFGASFVISSALGFIYVMVSWIPCFGWIVGPVIMFVSMIYILTVYAHLFGQFGLVAFGQNQPLG